MKKLKPGENFSIIFGCDPEFFIEFDGVIQGSETIIPEKGMLATENFHSANAHNSKIKRDGVQCELNPSPKSCRAYLHNEIVACFLTLKNALGKNNITSKQVIKMNKKVLNNLSKEARKFGCAPSNNAYTKCENKINVSPSRYLYRSAGGHIHIGKPSDIYGREWSKRYEVKIFDDIPKTIKLFDIMVGCTGTLLDRDIWAKERRKVYGRAGDYRTPKYGFEYRTLSNFWLKDYIYMSLMFGLARTACEFLYWGWEQEIFRETENIDIEGIINDNDINGAIEVYNIMEEYYKLLDGYDHFPLNRNTVKPFRKFFMSDYKPGGKDNLIDYWCKRKEGHIGGFCNTMRGLG